MNAAKQAEAINNVDVTMHGRATPSKRIPNAEPSLSPLGVAVGRVMSSPSHGVNDAQYFPRDAATGAPHEANGTEWN